MTMTEEPPKAKPGRRYFAETLSFSSRAKAPITARPGAPERRVAPEPMPTAAQSQAALEFVVRDGATGAGAILWRIKLACPAGDSRSVVLSGLNIIGSVATAMTVESVGAPAATNVATVTMTGYTAFP